MVSIDEDLDKITKMQTLLEASEWNLGPDELMPANSYYSCELATPVLLKSKENDAKKYPPISIYTMFKCTVDKKPHHPALGFKPKPEDPWHFFSYLEYWKMCVIAAKSFISVINSNLKNIFIL